MIGYPARIPVATSLSKIDTEDTPPSSHPFSGLLTAASGYTQDPGTGYADKLT